MEFQRILVRATNWVGDAVMSIPALQALRIRFPRAHIAILAKPWVAGLYGREPFCDELIPYEAPPGRRGLATKWNYAVGLRRHEFDCAILFQNAFESALIARLAGIPERVGYNRDGRGWLLTRSVPVPKPGDIPRHQRFCYLELLKRAELIPDYSLDSEIRLSGAAKAAEQGRARLRQLGVLSSVIGVSPGAAYGGAKRWLPDRFGKTAVNLARDRQATIAVFGSKEEAEVCAGVQQSVEAAGQPCLNFAGATTLSEYIELAAACELYLTNDSGPMHIVSALGIPTVAIFGATDETATGPSGIQSRVVRKSVDCSPCLLRECPIDHRCMTGVTVEEVSEAALGLIAIDKR